MKLHPSHWMLACWLGLLAAVAPLGHAQETTALERGEALRASLTPDAPTANYAAAAREFGKLVDELRQTEAPDETLVKLRKVAADMRKQTVERLKAAETATGGDEGGLESFYRSQAWEDLSFSMTAFPFWGSWLDLTLAGRPSRAADRIQLLWRARRGFRAASMQIYQPSLVYGGWLGLGSVEAADSNPVRAKEIFESLIQSLSFDDKHPVRKAAEAQLAILSGKMPPPEAMAPAGGAAVDPRSAEIFALLEQHRKTKVGNREAGQRLRDIIAAGGMNMQLIVDLLKYQAEIVGQDLGAFSPLIDAEFAFTNQQWFTAVQKYRDFFAREPHGGDLNFDRFRYRYAAACLKADLNDEAARIAEKLLQTPKLEAELTRAATKLAYVARARRMESKSTDDARKALATAAQRFIDSNPKDPDVLGAKVALAQSTGDTATALKLLGSAQSPDNAKGSIETARFYLIARQFAKVANSTGAGTESLAREGLAAFESLPANEKKLPDNQAFLLQLRAVADADPKAVLKAIELAEQKPGVSTTNLRGYYWARLRLYDRLGEPRRALAEIEARRDDLPGWMAEQLYPWVKRLADKSLQAEMAVALAPKVKSIPEMSRRFRMLNIEILLERQEGEAAYDAAREFVKDYPKAGDAYRLLARSAEATRRWVEADDAWNVITSKVPPSFDVWWEGMLARVEIRAGSTRPQSACELAGKIDRSKPPKPEFGKQWAALRKRLACSPPG